MYKKLRFCGVGQVFCGDRKCEGEFERSLIRVECENFEDFGKFGKIQNFFDGVLKVFDWGKKGKQGVGVKVDIDEIFGQIGKGFVLLPVRGVEDIEIDEFFDEGDWGGEEVSESFRRIEQGLEGVIEETRVDLGNSEVFIKEIVDLEQGVIEVDSESEGFFVPDQSECPKTLQNPSPEFFLNFNRTIFDLSVNYPDSVLEVKDIRLKKRELSEVSVKSGFSDQIPSKLSIPGVKITVVNSVADLEKLKIEKKSISFSLGHESNEYCSEENVTQIQKVPVKVFYDCSSTVAQYLLDRIVMDKFNVIGLETPSGLINGVDLVLTWQTAVKVIQDTELKGFASVKEFLKTVHFSLIKFDTLLIVLLGKGFYSDNSAEEVVGLYAEFLLQFGVSCKVIKTDNLETVEWCIKDYILRYMAQITDLGSWVELQEKISDLHPKVVDDTFNIYTLHVIHACKPNESSELTRLCNLLGTNSHEKYENILKYYNQLRL